MVSTLSPHRLGCLLQFLQAAPRWLQGRGVRDEGAAFFCYEFLRERTDIAMTEVSFNECVQDINVVLSSMGRERDLCSMTERRLT